MRRSCYSHRRFVGCTGPGVASARCSVPALGAGSGRVPQYATQRGLLWVVVTVLLHIVEDLFAMFLLVLLDPLEVLP